MSLFLRTWLSLTAVFLCPLFFPTYFETPIKNNSFGVIQVWDKDIITVTQSAGVVIQATEPFQLQELETGEIKKFPYIGSSVQNQNATFQLGSGRWIVDSASSLQVYFDSGQGEGVQIIRSTEGVDHDDDTIIPYAMFYVLASFGLAWLFMTLNS